MRFFVVKIREVRDMTELEKEELKREWTEEQKAARRAYKREWNRKHPDKVKEYTERYWRKKVAQMKAQEEGRRDGV